jgi:hypothetical protein
MFQIDFKLSKGWLKGYVNESLGKITLEGDMCI